MAKKFGDFGGGKRLFGPCDIHRPERQKERGFVAGQKRTEAEGMIPLPSLFPGACFYQRKSFGRH